MELDNTYPNSEVLTLNFGVQISSQPKSHTQVLPEYSEIVFPSLIFMVNITMNLISENMRGGNTIHCTRRILKNYTYWVDIIKIHNYFCFFGLDILHGREYFKPPGPRKSDPSLRSSGPGNQKPTKKENSNAVIPVCFRTLYRIQRPRPSPPNATSHFLFLSQFPIQLYRSIFGFHAFNSHFTSSPPPKLPRTLHHPFTKPCYVEAQNPRPPNFFLLFQLTHVRRHNLKASKTQSKCYQDSSSFQVSKTENLILN